MKNDLSKLDLQTKFINYKNEKAFIINSASNVIRMRRWRWKRKH